MKKIVLTGGANGIGRAIVESLTDKAELYVIDRDQEAGEALEKNCLLLILISFTEIWQVRLF